MFIVPISYRHIKLVDSSLSSVRCGNSVSRHIGRAVLALVLPVVFSVCLTVVADANDMRERLPRAGWRPVKDGAQLKIGGGTIGSICLFEAEHSEADPRILAEKTLVDSRYYGDAVVQHRIEKRLLDFAEAVAWKLERKKTIEIPHDDSQIQLGPFEDIVPFGVRVPQVFENGDLLGGKDDVTNKVLMEAVGGVAALDGTTMDLRALFQKIHDYGDDPNDDGGEDHHRYEAMYRTGAVLGEFLAAFHVNTAAGRIDATIAEEQVDSGDRVLTRDIPRDAHDGYTTRQVDHSVELSKTLIDLTQEDIRHVLGDSSMVVDMEKWQSFFSNLQSRAESHIATCNASICLNHNDMHDLQAILWPKGLSDGRMALGVFDTGLGGWGHNGVEISHIIAQAMTRAAVLDAEVDQKHGPDNGSKKPTHTQLARAMLAGLVKTYRDGIYDSELSWDEDFMRQHLIRVVMYNLASDFGVDAVNIPAGWKGRKYDKDSDIDPVVRNVMRYLFDVSFNDESDPFDFGGRHWATEEE